MGSSRHCKVKDGFTCSIFQWLTCWGWWTLFHVDNNADVNLGGNILSRFHWSPLCRSLMNPRSWCRPLDYLSIAERSGNHRELTDVCRSSSAVVAKRQRRGEKTLVYVWNLWDLNSHFDLETSVMWTMGFNSAMLLVPVEVPNPAAAEQNFASCSFACKIKITPFLCPFGALPDVFASDHISVSAHPVQSPNRSTSQFKISTISQIFCSYFFCMKAFVSAFIRDYCKSMFSGAFQPYWSFVQ